MCGRVIQSSAPFRLAIVEGLDVRDSRLHNYPPRWNGAPSQELLVIVWKELCCDPCQMTHMSCTRRKGHRSRIDWNF